MIAMMIRFAGILMWYGGLVLCAGALGGAAPPVAAPLPADLVVINAKVITVDPQSRIAQAVAIQAGRFVAVGTNDDVRPFIGGRTRAIDAHGRAVIPGLIDSHVHATGVARAEADQPFVNLSSIAEIQDWVRAQAARWPAGTWIFSPRVFPTRVRERRFPTRAELDVAAPRHPVVIDGAYALMVNSAALRAAQITVATPDPQGGAIVRDARGEPTGLLRNVGGLLSRFQRRAREALPLDGLARVHEQYVRAGITSVIERGASVEDYRAYETLKREGRLQVRAVITIRIPRPQEAQATERFIRTLPFKPRAGDEWLKMGPLKLVVDGGILAGTSFMRQPYGLTARSLYGVDDPSYRGFLTVTRERIAATVLIGHQRGYQMAAHVTGNAGVDAVLDAFEAAQKQFPSPDRRHTLIHAYFADPDTAMRAARLGVAVDTQPAWYYKDADALAPALGLDRLASFIGLRTWRAAGVHTAINTDHMFGLEPNTALNPFNPFLTLAVAVTRRTEGGQVIGPDERVTREQALRMMTIEAARVSFDETSKGSIETGKLGDLTILSADLLTCPEDRIQAITPDVTIIGGRVAYERSKKHE